MLVHKKEVIRDFKLGVTPILWPIVIICGLILPADFSTAAMLFIVCFIMLFVGGTKLKHLSAIIGVSIAGFAILILLNLAFPGLLPRVDTWQRITSFESGSQKENYQAEMAKRAVANGFLFGKGQKGSCEKRLVFCSIRFIYASL